LQQPLANGELAIHLIGRGEVEPRLERALQRSGIVKRGFVEDIEAEYKSAWAMIVPTPIKLGFRTRILESFRHGVCVVSHRANAAGFPELVDGRNCLLADTGRDFARQMIRLAADGELRRRLSRQAYEDFHTDLAADLSVEKMLVALRGRLSREPAGIG
jgi:glycosyltransferase involved in cell wall biosynthesis